MSIGFGRVSVAGAFFDDPYDERIQTLASFELLSDQGPNYSVERVNSRLWNMARIEAGVLTSVGEVRREGTILNLRYVYKRSGRLLSAGWQNGFMNAFFGLIGEIEGL